MYLGLRAPVAKHNEANKQKLFKQLVNVFGKLSWKLNPEWLSSQSWASAAGAHAVMFQKDLEYGQWWQWWGVEL